MWPPPMIYDKSCLENLNVKFRGASRIERNFSQCFQDMFVLTMLNGKKGGHFLEIGSGHPFYCNNTVLLEKLFNWDGISIDKDVEITELFSKYRCSKVINSDAVKLNYEELLDFKDYHYLQIDCDPSFVSYEILLQIPFRSHRFAVITFEHDYYTDKRSGVMENSRKILQSYGYELIANDIAPDNDNSFEDWWVCPELVDEKIIESMRCLTDSPKRADDYMLGRTKSFKCNKSNSIEWHYEN
jgi:hypothetical protein